MSITRMSHEHTNLHPDQIAQIERIREAGLALINSIEALLKPTRAGGILLPREAHIGREVDIAKQRAEEAVMWAVKAATW